jgi:hypothetical protein
MLDAVSITKSVVNLATGIGTSKVVNDIIQNNTTVESKPDAWKVWLGSAVIGSMAADSCSKHVNAKLDKATDWWEARKAAKANADAVSS